VPSTVSCAGPTALCNQRTEKYVNVNFNVILPQLLLLAADRRGAREMKLDRQRGLGVRSVQVLVVNVDTQKFITATGDENTILPKRLFKALLAALDMARAGE